MAKDYTSQLLEAFVLTLIALVVFYVVLVHALIPWYLQKFTPEPGAEMVGGVKNPEYAPRLVAVEVENPRISVSHSLLHDDVSSSLRSC